MRLIFPVLISQNDNRAVENILHDIVLIRVEGGTLKHFGVSISEGGGAMPGR